jgi:hypothetical protein
MFVLLRSYLRPISLEIHSMEFTTSKLFGKEHGLVLHIMDNQRSVRDTQSTIQWYDDFGVPPAGRASLFFARDRLRNAHARIDS